MSEPKIEIKKLSKVYFTRVLDYVSKKEFSLTALNPDDKLVLKDINLCLSSGETIGIIGRNGAGKSTLLSIIAGISNQTSGELNITGKVTAVMTLGVGLRDDLTGRENIYLDGDIQGKPKDYIESVINNIIDFAELDEFIDKPVKTYSTGMKSRLAFSMLVEIEPEILIIDEALSAGDVFFASKATKKIQEICNKGKIVIIVSHSMQTIESMCNRCLWMEKGEIMMDDIPELVTKTYLKKIKEEDEQADVSSNRYHISNTSECAQYKITEVHLKQQGSDYAQTVFYTQDSFSIAVQISRTTNTEAHLAVSIERIDGVIVHDKVYDLKQANCSDISIPLLFQLTLESLVINKGYYQLKLELVESGKITNYYTRVFEVRNESIPKGGVPLLHYPAIIAVVNEEKSECSDSIELIIE